MFLPKVNTRPLYKWKMNPTDSQEGWGWKAPLQVVWANAQHKQGQVKQVVLSSFECQVSRTGKLRTGHSRCARWKGRIISCWHWLATHTLPETAQMLSAFCAADSCSTCCQPGAPGPSLQSCFPVPGPPTVHGQGCSFPLAHLRLPSAYSSSLLRSLNNHITGVINYSSNFLLSSNLLNVHSATSLISFHQGISQYSSHATPLTHILNFSISWLLQPKMPLIFTLPTFLQLSGPVDQCLFLDHQRDNQ